jgi:DNA-binding SARP family transcriptional activator
MAAMLDRHAARIGAARGAFWRERLARIREERRAREERPGGEERMRLSMLGTIAIEGGGVEAQAVRGARLKALLGVMVANQMQRRPLGREEFWILAGGVGDDPNRSRKTMHQAVLRLRELLGRDAILTDTDVPRLNADVIRVDIIDAARLLDEALEASRSGALARARTALASALDMARGEVPFPALYEEFFEAAREEFENMMRNAILDVGGRLLREGDAASAEEILGRGLDSIPEDEDLCALLRAALEAQGKHVEAARLRLRIAMAE